MRGFCLPLALIALTVPMSAAAAAAGRATSPPPGPRSTQRSVADQQPQQCQSVAAGSQPALTCDQNHSHTVAAGGGPAYSADSRSGGRFGEQVVGETDEVSGEVPAQGVTQNRTQVL